MEFINERLQSKKDEIKLYDKKGRLRLKFYKNSKGFSSERTYDKNGNQLTYKNSNGYSSESTYDKNGNELIYKRYQNGKLI